MLGNKQIKKSVILTIAVITIFFALCIGETSGSTGTGSISSENLTQLSASSQNSDKLYGIDFSPYIDGQNPNYGSKVDREQVIERLTIIAPHTTWIRTYGTENGLEYIGPVAHELGLKTAIGAWLSSDTEANDRQINELINESKNGYVDLAIVGSETLLRNDLSEDQLIEYIRRVKQAVPGINVTTADTYSELLNHPRVMAECDVVMYNSYPYWEGTSIDSAIEVQDNVYKSIADQINNKPIIVSETGWPSAGNTIESAVPSPENSARYFNDFVSWARKNNVQYFYFEAFDETWKANYEGPQGAHWGIWDKDGNLKPRMETILSGESETKEINETDAESEEPVSKLDTGLKESMSSPSFGIIYGLVGLLAVFLYRRK
ncbi:MAG: glycosyl hydrolase family 17 protein [Methanosarcina sp.]|uniref:glycosyl hydrolase family 17 protein n=1 Tax=Methanosarcina sp. TaxID=2213 RepID=UPI00262A2BD7|nr:glycosyl hydrolase family 17 protein [Methanosarcina sp.]MDD3248024.1 glycosyl hydrolase family 17 protein [Methanosarcina sp.]